MSRSLLIAALLLVALPAVCLANPQPVPEPTWLAVPPVVLPYQPVFPALWNTSMDDIQVRDTWPWQIVHFEGQSEVVDFDPFGQPWAVVYPPTTGATWIWGGTTNSGLAPEPGLHFAKTEWWWTIDPGTVYAEYAPIQILAALNWHVEQPAGSDLLTLVLSNDSPTETFQLRAERWQILDLAGNSIIQPSLWPDVLDLSPGELFTDTCDLSALAPGEYIAQIELYDAMGVRSFLRDQFTRLPYSPGAVVWSVEPAVNSTKSAVGLTLTNATASMIWLPSYGPWQIEDTSGNPVYAPLSAQAIVPMAPAATYAWSWLEQDNTGAWVPPGDYVAKVHYYTEDPTGGGSPTLVEQSFPFVLVEPASGPGCLFLETDKLRYEPDETVQIEFVNCTPTPIGMHSQYTWWVSTVTGVPVYGPIVLYARTLFDPGEGFLASWDQTFSYGSIAVPAGFYIINATFTDELFLTNYVVVSAPFEIQRPTPVDALPAAAAHLAQSYPNPFNPKATLRYTIARSEYVSLAIFDVAGQRLRTLVDAVQEGPREHEVIWDGRDDAGCELPGGVYLARLETPSAAASTKLVLLK